MSIAQKWIDEGHSITWPVLPHFVEGLKAAYNNIEWLDYRNINVDYQKRDEHDHWFNGILYRVVPLRWANEILGREYKFCMKSKYDLLQMDWTKWKEKAMWQRNEEREEVIMEETGANWWVEYTVVNRFFGSDSQFQCNIPVEGIEMDIKKGYSLFDYAKLLENATYIHVANSSILYFLELLDLKAKEIHLYCRKPLEKDFKNTSYLFTKPYILHS